MVISVRVLAPAQGAPVRHEERGVEAMMLRCKGLRSFAVVSIVCAALGVAACGDSNNSNTGTAATTGTAAGTGTAAAGAGNGEKVNIAQLTTQLDNTYTQGHIAGVKQAVDADGNASVKVFNSNFQPNVQVRQCNDAVTSGQYNAIVIQVVTGTSVIPCVKRAIAKGIKVVSIDNAIGPSFDTLEPQVEGVSGTVTVPSPYDVARITKQLDVACEGKDPCRLVQIIGVPGFGYDAARDALLDTELKSRPNVKLLTRQPGLFQEAVSYKAMRTILQAHPDFDVLLTAGDQMTLGAEKALNEANKTLGPDGIRVISTGLSTEAAPKIKSGEWQASGVMLPITTGKIGAEIAIKAVRGIEQSPEETQVIPPETVIPGGEVTKDNVDQVTPEYASR
jgi:ribose transport system substrate-binding protein